MPSDAEILDEIETKAKNHDWWYMFSDDHRVYRAGERSADDLILQLVSIPFKEGKRIWDDHCPWSTPEKAKENKLVAAVPFHLIFKHRPATHCIGSDRYPCTVINMSKNGHKLSYQHDVMENGQPVFNDLAEIRYAYWSEKRQVYLNARSARVRIGYRDYYMDPHF